MSRAVIPLVDGIDQNTVRIGMSGCVPGNVKILAGSRARGCHYFLEASIDLLRNMPGVESETIGFEEVHVPITGSMLITEASTLESICKYRCHRTCRDANRMVSLSPYNPNGLV